jgi:hypothetical protein
MWSLTGAAQVCDAGQLGSRLDEKEHNQAANHHLGYRVDDVAATANIWVRFVK